MNIADDLKNAYYDGYDNGYNAGFEAGQRDVLLEKTQLSREDTTSDPVSRRAAIDAGLRLCGRDTKMELINLCEASIADSEGRAGAILDYIGELEDLPSAQPETARDTNVLDNDTISRQAAIDVIEHRLTEPAYQHVGEDWYDGMNCAECELYNLPSAQPDEAERNRVMKLDFQNWETEEAGEVRFGDRLYSLIAKRGITQRDLAKACGITEVSMSRYISNGRVPKATVIIALAKALNVSADTLLGLPTAQPEPDIIACGDCKHYISHDRWCGYWNHGVKPLEWCCHAERRGEGEAE